MNANYKGETEAIPAADLSGSGRLASAIRDRVEITAMKVYVGNALLLESQEFKEKEKETAARKGEGFERDRDIYVWDPFDAVRWQRLSKTPIDITRSIIVSAGDYDREMFAADFPGRCIEPPNKIIRISGYFSYIPHHLSKAKEVCRVLANASIEYLVNNCREPILRNVEHCSQIVGDALMIEVKRVSL